MIIQEELHPELRNVIDNPNLPAHHKHNAMVRLYRTLLKKGMETGLADTKPKKGSSRAVYFPSEPDDITIDGQKTKMRSVLKIAYPGRLDPYNKTGLLFGEHQNIAEGNRHLQDSYGMLKLNEDGTYKTNPNGILAPVIHAHESGHYLHMGQISPIRAGDFRNLTKTEDFPKGISHNEFYDACNHEFDEANGYRNRFSDDYAEKLEKIKEHPLTSMAISFSFHHGTHPGDFVKGNMGIWEHPVTGSKHIVISDYGADANLVREYNRARMAKYISYW